MTPQIVSASILVILKILVVAGILMYGLFAAVLVRQEQLMANVLEETFEPVLRILVVAHLVLAAGLLVLSFILL